MRLTLPILTITAALLFAGPAVAQSDTDAAEQRNIERKEAEYAEKLREAERQMAEAARRVAELTSERLPQIHEIERRFAFSDKPRIGISIDGANDSGAVEGVEVIAVTPDSAADDAGLRSGDVLTSINGEDLAADSSMAANKMLFEFMDGVEEGDELSIDYLRNGNRGTVELSPRKTGMHAFAWAPQDGKVFVERFVDGTHGLKPGFSPGFRFAWAGSSLGSMELVELSEDLGRYFGTDQGLLVVSAPHPEDLGLKDGDVIQSIDGREPKDVRHALKILGSYDSGEELELSIMRDKKRRTLELQVPDRNAERG